MIESLINSAAADHPDAALLALGAELEAAIEEIERLPVSECEALKNASARKWEIIDAISAIEARTDAGLAVMARAVARAHIELLHVSDDELGADERALKALVRSVFAGRKIAA
jgi:transketolase